MKGPSKRSVEMYEGFNGFEPREIIVSNLTIPSLVYYGGPAVNVMYRSDKRDPSNGRLPKKPVDYIHEHEKGVGVYLASPLSGGRAHNTPMFIKNAKELVLLGESLGLVYVNDEGDQIEGVVKKPYPKLYTLPSGKALFVVQGESKVLAIIWGGRLGVEPRGIVY